MTTAGKGGIINAVTGSYFAFDTITVTTVSLAGEGVFLYLDNTDSIPFTMLLSNSDIQCKTSSTGYTQNGTYA